MKNLFENIKLIEETYYRDIKKDTEKKLLDYFIWLQEDQYLKLSDNSHLNFILGILGIKYKVINERMVEVIGFYDSRTRKILKGDIIIMINNCLPFNIHKNVNKLKITVIRNLYNEDIEIIEEEYCIPNILSNEPIKYIDYEDFFYLKFHNFNNNMEKIYELVKNSYVNNKKYLIFDLRNNIGGSVKNATKLLQQFQLSTSIAYSMKNKNKITRITSNGKIKYEKIIVLINESTMSSAELVVSSLKQNDNTLIIGKKTFGKGVMLKYLNLDDGYAITIPKYLIVPSNGDDFNNIGIYPDKYIDDAKINNLIENKQFAELLSV